MTNYPVRVLQVFTILNRGGAESMIMNYYRHIDRTQVQFDFLVHRPERGDFEDEIEELGGRIYRMPAINPLYPFGYYHAIDSFFKKHNYDIIHSHINALSLFPIKIAKKNNIQIRVSHSHTSVRPFTLRLFFEDPKESLKILFKNSLRKKINKYAVFYFACGQSAGKWLFGESLKFHIINNSIDPQLFVFNNTVSEKIRKELSFENKIVVGHVGNFSYPKNYSYIISVFNKLKAIREDLKLVLIGDGHKKSEIEDLVNNLGIENDVTFLGVRNEINELMQAMDVFLFPSFYEGLPVTLVEAQAAGLKIFASDTITREVSLTEDITFLSLKESPEYWAKQILSAYPYERKNNSEIIKEKGYDISDSAKKLQNFYLEQIALLNS